MSPEKWLSVVCPFGFGSAGVFALMSGQTGAGLCFFAFAAFIVLAFSYQAYRQRSAPVGGPPDPSEHWSSDAGASFSDQVATFTYSKETLVVLRYVLFLPSLVGPVIYFTSSPRPAGFELAGLGALEILILLVLYAVYRTCAMYSIEIAADNIGVFSILRKRNFPFCLLGTVALLEGGGRGPRYVVALYDKHGKQMCTLSNGVEGFDRMVALIKKFALASGVPYRYRDMWGCWTG